MALAITNLEKGRVLVGINFYTGVHLEKIRPDLHQFWHNKLNSLKKREGKFGITVRNFTRPLKYTLIDDVHKSGEKYYLPREKGIDVRLSLDLVRLARYQQFDVAVIFSQDTDLVEAVHEVRAVERELNKSFQIECAFPGSEKKKKIFGIMDTKWRVISKDLYDSCIDPNTDLYFPKPPMFKKPE